MVLSVLVVYRSIPTSNRNYIICMHRRLLVVYRSIPTSNRNCRIGKVDIAEVVYRSIPTSNRNNTESKILGEMLYIVLFLHQTATSQLHRKAVHSCISFYSYIKPQQARRTGEDWSGCISFYSYIKPQPHASEDLQR